MNNNISEIRRKRIQEKRTREAIVIFLIFFALGALTVAAALLIERRNTPEPVQETEAETTIYKTISVTENYPQPVAGPPCEDLIGYFEVDHSAEGTGASDNGAEETIELSSSNDFVNNNVNAHTQKSNCTVDECTGKEIQPEAAPHYTVAGLSFPLDTFLYNSLKEYGREEFYELILCQIFQESRFDVTRISDDGLDHGVLQFRARYWESYAEPAGFSGADIMDPYVQIAAYCWHLNRRLNEGCNIYEAISRHFESDYGEYNAQYVADVTQWLDTMVRTDGGPEFQE